MKFINSYIEESRKILEIIDKRILIKFIKEIANLRNRKGRIFFLGMGGSAGNCSHAVNDFRKLCEIESYTPTSYYHPNQFQHNPLHQICNTARHLLSTSYRKFPMSNDSE